MAKTGTDLANQMLEKPLTPQTYDEFKTQLGRHPTEEEYKQWTKPRIAQRVKEYRDQKMDEKLALSELNDEFGYEDLINEAWYGHPRRSDLQVLKDRIAVAMKDPKKKAIAPGFETMSDEDLQEMMSMFGFNRNGEW